MKTRLFESLAMTVKTHESVQTVALEVLWCLLNISYCCQFDQEINKIIESLLIYPSLQNLWFESLDLDANMSAEMTNFQLQRFHLALIFLGNVFGQVNAADSHQTLLSGDHCILTVLENAAPKLKYWPELLDILQSFFTPNSPINQ